MLDIAISNKKRNAKEEDEDLVYCHLRIRTYDLLHFYRLHSAVSIESLFSWDTGAVLKNEIKAWYFDN